MALLVPAFALYPSLEAFAITRQGARRHHDVRPAGDQSSRRHAAPERSRHRANRRDGRPRDASSASGPTPTRRQPIRHSRCGRRTVLAEHRITSAIELYTATGRLLSRFALNLPEYDAAPHIAPSCRLDHLRGSHLLCGERSPRAPRDARHLHARGHASERSSCASCSTTARCRSFLRSARHRSARPWTGRAETTLGRDVDFTVYGWSQAPLYTFGQRRLAACSTAHSTTSSRRRDPFWATITRDDGRRFRVYYMIGSRAGSTRSATRSSPRSAILVNLAELASLTGVLWALLLGGATLFNALDVEHAGQRPRAAPRSALQLLPKALAGIRRRSGRAGADPGVSARAYFANQFTRQRERGRRARRPPSRSGSSRTTRRSSRGRRAHFEASRRSGDDPGQPGDRSGRQPLRSEAASGHEPAGSLHRRCAAAANARRCVSRRGAQPAADVRGRGTGWRRHAIFSPRPASAPASARASSPCRSRCARRKRTASATISIGRCSSGRCCS